MRSSAPSLFSALLLLAAGLSGCGEDASPSPSPTPEPTYAVALGWMTAGVSAVTVPVRMSRT